MHKFLDKNEKIEFMKQFIKFITSTRGYNLTNLCEKLHKNYGRKQDLSNFSAKLRRGSLTIVELAEIFEVLDYEIDFKDLRKYTKRQDFKN